MAKRTNNRRWTCLYTGAPQEIVFNDGPGDHGWYLEGGFDPALPFLSEEDAVAAFRRRGGRDNAVAEPSCPYTGTKVVFVHERGLWWPRGAFFLPRLRRYHREQLVYEAEHREGVPAGRPPKLSVATGTGEPTQEFSDPTEGLGDTEVDRDRLEEVLKS